MRAVEKLRNTFAIAGESVFFSDRPLNAYTKARHTASSITEALELLLQATLPQPMRAPRQPARQRLARRHTSTVSVLPSNLSGGREHRAGCHPNRPLVPRRDAPLAVREAIRRNLTNHAPAKRRTCQL